MDNRHQSNLDLKQLERDAEKVGAWQAKLALAQYYISKNIEIEKAKNYLKAVTESNSEYSAFASILLQKIDVTNAIAIALAQSNQVQVIENFLNKAVSGDAPETQYKVIRQGMSGPNIKNSSLDEKYQQLTGLLTHSELTDTLKAKIYFQLIHLNLQFAVQTGQKYYLDRAVKACDRLTSDANLKDMSKTKLAVKLKENIQGKMLKDPVVYPSDENERFAYIKLGKDRVNDISFLSFIVGTLYNTYQGVRLVSKYIGIAVGNAVDLSFLTIPKIANASVTSSKNRTDGNLYLKNAGFAGLMKWAGKRVLTQILAVPVLIAMTPIYALAYPFVKLWETFSSDTDVKNAANSVLDLQKDKVLTSSMPASSAPASSTGPLKKVFELDTAKHDVRFPVSEQTSNAKPTARSVQYKLDGQKANLAYGRLFVEHQKPVASNVQMTPVYQSVTPSSQYN